MRKGQIGGEGGMERVGNLINVGMAYCGLILEVINAYSRVSCTIGGPR